MEYACSLCAASDQINAAISSKVATSNIFHLQQGLSGAPTSICFICGECKSIDFRPHSEASDNRIFFIFYRVIVIFTGMKVCLQLCFNDFLYSVGTLLEMCEATRSSEDSLCDWYLDIAAGATAVNESIHSAASKIERATRDEH